MLESLNRSRGSRLLRTAAGVFRVSDWTLNRIDPDGLRYVATVSVWVHWCMAVTFLRHTGLPPLVRSRQIRRFCAAVPGAAWPVTATSTTGWRRSGR